ARVRRLMGTRRVGHAGTLDPLAEGVLPLALGRATRLLDRLADADKEYYAEAVLGLRTSTDDAEGDILARVELPTFGPADRAASLAEVEAHGLDLLLSPDAVLMGESALILDDEELRQVRSGGWWTGGPAADGAARGYALDGTFAALLEGRTGRWHPRRSFV